jgi:hypothetical protein
VTELGVKCIHYVTKGHVVLVSEISHSSIGTFLIVELSGVHVIFVSGCALPLEGRPDLSCIYVVQRQDVVLGLGAPSGPVQSIQLELLAAVVVIGI